MKKFAKFTLIVGGGLFLGGLLLALTCLALGADAYFVRQQVEKIGGLQLGGGDREWREYPVPEWEHPDREWYNPLETTEPWELPDQPEQTGAGVYEIKNLDFDFGLGDVHIITGEDFGLIYGNDNTHRFYSEVRGSDEWSIRSNKVRWRWFGPWRFSEEDIRLTVVLPQDFVAERMTISLGAGNLHAETLTAQRLVLDIGLGNCQTVRLSAANALLNVGVGNLEVGSFTVQEAQLEVGLGNMELEMAQPLDQYRCHVSVGLGSVKLGGNNYSGVADVNSGAADAPYSMDINCGLGSVRIEEEKK